MAIKNTGKSTEELDRKIIEVLNNALYNLFKPLNGLQKIKKRLEEKNNLPKKKKYGIIKLEGLAGYLRSIKIK